MKLTWLDNFAALTPGMLRAWEDHKAKWTDQGPLPVIACGELADAFAAELPQLTEATIRSVMNEVDRICAEEGEPANTEILTGFIECLTHLDSAGDFDMTPYAPLLGPRSVAYIKAWDKFTGARTRGVQ